MFFSKSDFNHTEGSIFDKQKLYPGALSTYNVYVCIIIFQQFAHRQWMHGWVYYAFYQKPDPTQRPFAL